MVDDMAYAHQQSQPGSWASRYEFDMESQTIRPKNGGEAPAAFAYAAVTKLPDGSFNATMPSLAVASRPSYFMNAPSDFDIEFFSMWEPMGDRQDGKWEIRRAIHWWRVDPLVFNCIGFLANMANAAFSVECDDEDQRSIMNNWNDEVMGFDFRSQWFTEYFRTGMVPVLKTLVKYKPKALKDSRIPPTNSEGNVDGKAIASTTTASTDQERLSQELVVRTEQAEGVYTKALAAYETGKTAFSSGLCSEKRLEILQRALASAQYEWNKGMIPGAFTILDPLLVDMDGPREMGLLRQPFLRITGDLQAAIMEPRPQTLQTIATLPPEITQQIKDGNEKVWLSPNICSMTFGDKQPYERYPTPITVHAFTALEMKRELTDMDRATSRHVKNRVLLVKVGNDEYPEFDNSKIAIIQHMFNAPGKNMTMVWNHCIELEWIEPNLDSLKDTEKYKFWNSEIRTVYGVSPVLTGTSETAGAIGNSMMNFKGVQERVAEAQGKYLEFYNRELKMFRAAIGLKGDAWGAFDPLNGKDELQYWTVLTQAVMNGIIDHQTALEMLSFSFPTVQKRMKKIKELQKQGLFVPMPSANNMGPDGKPNKPPGGQPPSKKGNKPGTGGKGGKPAGKTGQNQNRTGKSTPKKVKATAKIQPLSDDRAVLVVDSETLDTDHVNQLAGRFGIPTDWVMTKASYEKEYGPIDMEPTWPALTMMETVAAMSEGGHLRIEVDAEIEQATASYKSDTKGGERKPYITEKVKGQIEAQAKAKVLQRHKDDDIGQNVPKAWSRYVDEAVSGLTAEAKGPVVDPLGIETTAWALATARLKKMRPAN